MLGIPGQGSNSQEQGDEPQIFELPESATEFLGMTEEQIESIVPTIERIGTLIIKTSTGQLRIYKPTGRTYESTMGLGLVHTRMDETEKGKDCYRVSVGIHKSSQENKGDWGLDVLTAGKAIIYEKQPNIDSIFLKDTIYPAKGSTNAFLDYSIDPITKKLIMNRGLGIRNEATVQEIEELNQAVEYLKAALAEYANMTPEKKAQNVAIIKK